ncbi:glycosyltransferase [Cobetia sp. 14N.309.X.WAT.E.A4]|uniref:glycosyltransferase n=1 Tax=Cobetia sp. 14N.309.X.WAT.E.A4 TaxID=2998323 RepID=UPI0025AFF780|nr:glycosyltransferase [Cobetia sp. 14N.309.X.WAT.E.A4]MDN2658004.1 glycosyltransferase [Cobetia sp. 14N.309.X.WAT.E.A4]
MRILALGPLPPELGGTTVLFKDFCRKIRNHTDELVVIDINDRSSNKAKKVFNAFKLFFIFLYKLFQCDVITLHASTKKFVIYGAFLRLVSLITGKPVILRAFGGSLDLFYNRSGKLNKFIFKLAVSNTLILIETKYLINFISEKHNGLNIDWLPNSRSITKSVDEEKVRNNKFIFVGHVNEAKGIRTIIDAFKNNWLENHDVQVDIVGPITQSFPQEWLNNIPGLNYLGEKSPEEIQHLLGSYRCLILPTKYSGEGYPGVILEAYAQGTPVITTDWRSVPEIVVNNLTGIIVKPDNPLELYKAMHYIRFEDRVWIRMSRNARRYSKCFDSDKWHGTKWSDWLNKTLGKDQNK